jgi:lysophospholipase L1-like esterase
MVSTELLSSRRACVVALLAAATVVGARAADSRPPTVFLVGDSTVKTNTRGQQGWGDRLPAHLDPEKVKVTNRALGGRSSRSFLTEGLWDKVLADVRPGDFVLIQFGHNDGGSLSQGRARASLKGTGEQTQEVTLEATGKQEVVHTYGWYLRKYIADAQANGATPIILSPVPRNIWKDGNIARAANDYGKWAAESAKAGGALFLDLNDLVARRYEQAGPDAVKNQYFGEDHTHTTPAGAALTAAVVAEGLRGLTDCPLGRFVVPVRQPAAGFKFSFGPDPAPGFVPVAANTPYSTDRGYGFDLGSARPGTGRPFCFSVAVPEGNYAVTVALGDTGGGSDTTVKAESRRLLLESVRTARGELVTRRFTVNVRRADIAGGGRVRLKSREAGSLNWDDKLTLEFNGPRPALRTLEVEPADNAVTVYLLGDSTVTDQPHEPWGSWGQMLPRFFKPGVAVANHAESGESLKSALAAHRLDKVLSTMKPGDYLFMQFGHNDEKERGPGVGAFTTYKADLRQFVTETRRRGGQPVLVTPMHRRRFDDGGKVVDTHGDYPDAVRQVAKEENVPLIDLHAMSRPLYEAFGPDGSKAAFVDGTHHTNYGGYELARCVVEGIRRNRLGLAGFLAEDVSAFDPVRPDPVETFRVPASPKTSADQPDGN